MLTSTFLWIVLVASIGWVPPLVAEAAETASAPWAWRQIGPAPIRFDDPRSPFFGEGLGGVVYDIAIDPRGSTDQVIYVATNGGIWKTTDGGANWQPKTDLMPSNSTSAVALDPNDPDTVYAGTGAVIDPLGINYKAAGVYKSTDGGDGWVVLGGSAFGAPATCASTRNTSCGRGISRIVVLPGASNIVLAGTNNGLFRSRDGGMSWSAITSGISRNANITDLDVDTSIGSTVFASVVGVGVVRSVDSGATFTRNLLTRPGGPASGTFTTIAFAQSTTTRGVPNNRVMYANLASSAACASLGCPPLGIWRSLDYGRTWSQAPAAGLGNCQAVCAIDQSIGVDPLAPNIVHVGLIDYFTSSDWARFFARQSGVGHVDQVAITLSPTTHRRVEGPPASAVWVGNHGGVWRGIPRDPCIPILGCTYDWSSNNEGLANLGMVSLDIGRGSVANNGYSYSGVWDNGLVSKRPTDPGMDWHQGVGGDGGFVTVDPNNPSRAYGSGNSVLYVTDSAGGDGWTARSGGAPPFDGPPMGNPGDLTDTVWRMAIDASSRGASAPFTSQRVYALVANQVYRSIDAGINFTPISDASFVGGPNPLAIAIAPSDPDVVWLGMGDGTVRWTEDARSATPNWFGPVQVLSVGDQRPVTALAVDPADPTHVAVGYGYNRDGTPSGKQVFLTTDEGTTWADVTGNLPAIPINSVVIDPSTSPSSIIVANDSSVMYTTDPSSGAAWFGLGSGLPTVYSMEMAHDPSAVPEILRVGTYGRSVFELSGAVTDLRVSLRHEPEPVLGDTFTYQLFVTNAGFEPAIGVVAALELDSALTFVSGAGCSGPPADSNLVTCRTAGLDAPGGGIGVRFDIAVRVKECPPDHSVTSRASASSLLLSDTNPSNNEAEDTASLVCPVLDTFILSAVDGDGVDVPIFGKTTSTSMKFSLTGSEGTVSFECSIDQANFTRCTSPTTYENLIPGEHNFQVQSVDENGNRDPTPAQHFWTIL
ncbi:MAG: hypothetical protein L0206_08095 [Actinobacteria bacterium]|nr:hypothetical protein [Actinomycetota bacterium]